MLGLLGQAPPALSRKRILDLTTSHLCLSGYNLRAAATFQLDSVLHHAVQALQCPECVFGGVTPLPCIKPSNNSCFPCMPGINLHGLVCPVHALVPVSLPASLCLWSPATCVSLSHGTCQGWPAVLRVGSCTEISLPLDLPSASSFSSFKS